ncbi:tRNA threonylcarbamoyladenosine dehydratase [Parablautia muri]|uniref:tRNA threonylcarbamoyladenosine dehydratase n=1 Tax=Parablautia muri TaxID=2320879 RepID=A0A9X5BC45_9FIRM|nr:tRNA threonylcarbamoyladenosine dehydratase [Parablautia muri]NBJ91246.1 tRNA threonylcarbamoyladenosine dehydratase [Parablautia muri]
MREQFIRTELLFGAEAMKKLSGARVAVFGLGGVGSYTLEALVRSGVGTVDIIDDDKVCLSNLNRQLIATTTTIGMYKVDAACQRVKEINPQVVVHKYKTFYLPETACQFDFTQYDYIVDAIDTVTGKLELVIQAKKAGTPIISSMGAGNKIDPTAFEVADIYKTSVCPLAKVMRRELKKRGIKSLKVVYSKEPALVPLEGIVGNGDGDEALCENAHRHTKKRQTPGSNAFVPSVAGLIMAGEVIKDLAAMP